MAKQVTWSKKALAERIEILEYWNNKNKSNRYSKKLDTLFLEKIELVALHPLIGKKTDIEDVRIKLAEKHLIFYDITASDIHILSIKDGRQNPGKFKSLL
jgi:plasmid stabilization system protein ParE